MTRSTSFYTVGALFVLALGPGPVLAQDYIDVEAERRGQQSTDIQTYPGNTDPYTTQPSQPTTSTPVGGDTGSAANAGELFYQLQLLQQEVMELRGKVEEQEYQIRQLREQSLERYLDLDQRLKGGGAPATASTPTPGRPTGTTPAPQQELPGESDAYRAAYSLVRSQQFADAVAAFRQFLVDYPGGKFAANAHYWLGELYLVQVPPDDESARREFNLLIEQYPDNGKIPDALYKLGKIYYDRGNRDRAREYLDRVVNEFGDSGSSAVKLAQDFISQNY